PHADPQHVVVPGLALATLARPVPFGEMGAVGGSVDVRLVAMPLPTDAREHPAAPQRRMGLLRDDAAVAGPRAPRGGDAMRARAAVLLAEALPDLGPDGGDRGAEASA